jgi:uncharacterized protein YegL
MKMNKTVNLSISDEDLFENPTPRVPICLVLDCSGSMAGEPIQALNGGVQLLMSEIDKDEVAKLAAEVAVVSFGGSVQKVLDFVQHDQHDIPPLTATGGTPMGEAVNLALDLLDERKRKYQSVGMTYYQPWLVLMTDGVPTDDITYAASKVSNLVKQKKLTIFPIGVGDGSALETLRKFSPLREPSRLKGLEFSAFFEWLSASVSLMTQSGPGTKTPLPSSSKWEV